MEQIHPVLQYFAATSMATVSGIVFWIVVENMAGHKYRHILAVSCFFLLSPIGAWVVSWFVRMSVLARKDESQTV